MGWGSGFQGDGAKNRGVLLLGVVVNILNLIAAIYERNVMYTGFEMALAVLIGLLVGIVAGLFVYFLAAGGIRERERAQVKAEWEEWAFQMETHCASLNRELNILVRVSENLDGRITERLNERTTGHYVLGESTLIKRPDGSYGMERKREHRRGDWQVYSSRGGLLEAAVMDAETESGDE